MKAIWCIACGLLALPAMARAADPPVPEWARQAMAAAIPSYPSRVTTVVLFHEEAVTVDPDGHRVMRERGVVKALRPGADDLRAYRAYDTKNGRIRDFQGWMIPSTGKPIWYGSKQVVDLAVSREYTYDETREKMLDCGKPAPGAVFAWEVTEEEKTLFTQYRFSFQNREPGIASRFVLTLPASWEVRGTIFNHAPFDPQVSGNTWTWELDNLPAIEREPHSPSLAELAPRLAISYFPAAGNPAGLQGLRDWTAVSIWLAPLVDPASEVTDAIRGKAAELTANAASPFDRIRAIGEFVQKTNYVEVAMNLTQGGGYTPHKAAETLARNYGDCKDKAALMRALLKAVGIESWITVISATDRDYVREEWASPSQFNHAIIAVSVPDSVALPTVFTHPALGRLLMFDPTDRVTQMGGLPLEEQGSNALILAGAKGTLTRMPLLDPEVNRIESSTEASLDASGKLMAKQRREYFGQSSVPLRAVERLRGKDEMRTRFESALNLSVGNTALNGISTESASGDNHLVVNLDVTADRFGQNMQGKLLILRPGVLTSGGEYYFSRDRRTTPVKLLADLRQDTIRIRLPDGYKPDEMPRPAKIDGPYGSLEASWQVKDGELVMTQKMQVKPGLVPVEQYEAVRQFFERVGGAAAAPVVLAKQ
ncbi:MAG TPA: DUF3857 domain-containing protein [Bryobacteraceae bacterium]|nr:DUF3857 domain-containing protein [Bryobacteraceae bacterium]